MDGDKRINKIIKLHKHPKVTFRMFLQFIQPIHKLRNQEIQLLALLMYYHFTYSDAFKYEEDRWKKVFSVEVKSKIKKELKMNPNVLQNTLSSLRKKDAITKKNGYNEVNKLYMPGIEADTDNFTLSISFSMK